MHSLPEIRLVHWNIAESDERLARLRAAGYSCAHVPLDGAAALRELRQVPPAAVVIDLSRLPSHGREVALALRELKATRAIPLVFAGGEPEKVARIRALVPDAEYSTWARIGSALKKAIAQRRAIPVVPSSRMAGYSGTPLPKKLGIKPHTSVSMIGAPPDFEETLGALPEGVNLCRRRGKADLVLWFTSSAKALARDVERMGALAGAGGLWIIWPKRASGVKTDVTETTVREAGLGAGLVDYKVCAVDATWAGLRFARRKTA